MIISNIPHTVYMTFTVFAKFSKLLFVLHILAYSKFELRSFSLWWTLFKSSFQTLRTVCIWDLQCFETFRNCCLFCTFWIIRNFYSGDAHHANYGKRSLDHHFQHCAHSVYQILRIFKVFKIAVCFAHFASYEISTPEMRNLLTMANSLNHHFQHCAQCVYEIYSVFKVFERAVCFAHFGLFEISTPVRRIMLTIANIV